MKTKSKVAVGSIPAFAAFTTVLDMPVLSTDETEKAVLFQAPQYIPIPVADTVIDWFKIGEYDGERSQRYQRIFLIGIPKEIINRYKNIFRDAGLKLVSLELDGLAINRSILSENADVTLIIDLGSETSNIFIAKDGNIFYSGQTDYGGVYLTQAVARSLGISVMRAEELKKRRGLLSDGAESELSTLTQPFLDVIIQEVNHAKSTFEKRYGSGVNKAILIGGGANLLGVEKYFSREISMPVTKPNLFTKIEYDLKLEPLLSQLGNELPVAVGLAERYFIQ
jgi:type IV pilus assembly protein PilM